MGVRADWKKGSLDTLTLQGDLYRDETGERVSVATFSPPAETMLNDRAYATGGNIVARWRHETGESSDIQVQAYFDRTNLQDVELGETRDTFDFDFVQHQTAGTSQQLTWGLGARVSPSNFIQMSPGVNFLPHQQTDTIYSGFVQYELPIIHNRLTLTAGTKLDHNNFSGFEYQPSARLLWSPSDHQSLWAAVTRAVREPSRIDQDVSFAIFAGVAGTPPTPVYFEITGNPDFESERLLSYEVGYRRTFTPRVYLDVATFYNDYARLENYGATSFVLGSAPGTPPTAYLAVLLPYANGVEGNTVGAEIAPDWQVTPWWQLRATYSYLNMNLRDSPGFAGDLGSILKSYLGSSPSHIVNLQARIDLVKRFELDMNYRYVSALPA
jgi:iron complex outermembrane receptor protein